MIQRLAQLTGLLVGVASPLAAQQLPVKMEFDVRIPMKDGVTLSADVYRPDTAGRFPVILIRTPYDNATAGYIRRGRWWASRGYALVVQDVRGRGDSDGQFYPLVHEASDGDETITWAANQPWSSGKVGTTGASYLGWVQGYLAGARNPHLAAMVMIVTPPDPDRSWPVSFGSYAITTISWLASLGGHTQQNLSELDLAKAYGYRPYREMDTQVGRSIPVWHDWWDHPRRDDYWKAQAYQEKLLGSESPILHVSGWYDDVMIGTMENWTNLTTRATHPEERGRQWLVMGPWPHAVNTTTHLGDIDFGSQALIDLDGLQLRWFDHWLKDVDNGIEKDPRARIFFMGENAWHDEIEWPVARTRYVPYYLHSGGKANSGIGDGTLSIAPPVDEIADHFRYDPQNPVPFLGADTYAQAGGPDDYRPVERRDDVLVYSSPVLTQSLKVCGPIKARLHAASSAKDTDWTVMVLDVHPGGYAQRLNDGIVRARFRKGWDREEWLTPGKAEPYDIDVWATCQTILPGHRLRVDISSSANPKWDPNTNTGGPLGRETTGVTADQTIYHDQSHPSQIIIPIVP